MKLLPISPTLITKSREAVESYTTEDYTGQVDVIHYIEMLRDVVGFEALSKKVKTPLKGLKVAPYYGCMLLRPKAEMKFDDPEQPTIFEDFLGAIGCDVVDFPMKTECCGGHMTQIGPDTAFELIRRLIDSADQYKADVLVALCPMCQMNLDAFQGQMNGYFHTNYQMPILFFTQLMGVAFGIRPEKLGFGSEFVSAHEAMKRIGIQTPIPEASKPAPKKPAGLPMPPQRARAGQKVLTGNEEASE